MNPKILDDYYQRSISSVLGREISPSESENVNSLREFSPSDLEDLRTLGEASSLLAIVYIMFRIKGYITLNTAVGFYGAVIELGMPAEKRGTYEDSD